MKGKIIKGIAGFYYVHDGKNLYECKAKGIFRKNNLKPLVGDLVEFEILSQDKLLGNIVDILPRVNAIIRPNVANIDQAVIIFAIKDPAPNFNLLDRFLVLMNTERLPVTICFNKQDKITENLKEEIESIYKSCGSRVCFASTVTGEGMEELGQVFMGKTTAVAGPSGVGKSSIVNFLAGRQVMETGEISEKISRGKHTTRHSEIVVLGDDTYVLDTPGFSSLDLFLGRENLLKEYYFDFTGFEGNCRFCDCLHSREPECGVKQAVQDGKIHKIRYDNYLSLLAELKSQ